MSKVLQIMAGAEFGGAEEFFIRLIPALGRAGVKQHAIIRYHNERERILEMAGIPTHCARFGNIIDLNTRRTFKKVAQSFSPTIVLAWMSRAMSFCPTGEYILAGRLGGYYDLKYYKNCDHLIANTELIKSYLIKCGWPAERAQYIPNFVNGERATALRKTTYNTPEDAPLLLALGRLHENKAFDVLIAALANIPDAHLWIAGQGPLENYLKTSARTHGIEERIQFLGWQPNTPELLATADVLVCSSRHEPLGNVIIEGWAHGVPVVATETDGPRSLIKHQKSGLLVPIDDSKSLAAAIKKIISSDDLCKTLSGVGFREYETRFTEKIVVQRYQEFFREVDP